MLEPASQALGDTDEDVVALRLELADALFDSGDYRSAAPAYRQLIDDLPEDSDVLLHCRLKEATCDALTGETSLALRQLRGLLDDERRLFGDNDSRTFELRRQIGLLQLGAGQRSTAETTLGDLRMDLVRLHGNEHPDARKIEELLSKLP